MSETMSNVLDELISMSMELGSPAHDFAMLGEGNTSTRADADTFWVKASGTQLGRANRESFVRVRFSPVLDVLKAPTLDDGALRNVLKTATAEGERAPSIETFLHGMCLGLDGVRFVGHTHPTAAVGLLSGRNSRELFAGSLFPDQIVVIGPALGYVPYADPGLPLAQAVRSTLDDYLHRHQRTPKVLLMENHGVIALGSTAQEVINITHMLVKVCRVLAISLAAGGPRFLSQTQVDRIDNRPDELARRRGFA